MIYDFKSKAAGTVTMTKDVAESILGIIGKDPGPTGIITVEQIDGALATLEQASAASKAKGEKKEDKDGRPLVALSQRAYPFIEMLRECKKAGEPITWGV